MEPFPPPRDFFRAEGSKALKPENIDSMGIEFRNEYVVAGYRRKKAKKTEGFFPLRRIKKCPLISNR